MIPADARAGRADDPSARPDRTTLASIQVMRGLAALAVVGYHTHLILSQDRNGAIDQFREVLGRGWLGVQFFFVLSGFIIPFAHWKDVGQPKAAWRYVSRRLTRVYPIYWVCLTGFLVADLAGLGSSDFSWKPTSLLSAYALVTARLDPLLPMNGDLPLKVAWTLFYEIVFYIAFLLLVVNRALGWAVIALWLLAILYVSHAFPDGPPLWYFQNWNLYFFAGALVFVLLRWNAGPFGPLLFALGVGSLGWALVSGLVDPKIEVSQSLTQVAATAIPFILIIAGAALSERRYGLVMPSSLTLLGNASFAVYLVHSPVISFLGAINVRLSRVVIIPGGLLYVTVLVLATAAGIAVHFLVEKPLTKLLRSRSSMPRVAHDAR